jgi:hypothetical protein
MNNPLDTINGVFQSQGKACSMLSVEVDCHNIGRARRDFMRHQLTSKLGSAFSVTNDSRRFRVTMVPQHRAESS